MKKELSCLFFTLLAAVLFIVSPLSVSAAEKATAAIEIKDNTLKISVTAPEVDTALLGIVVENVSTGDIAYMNQDTLKDGKLTITTKLPKGEYKAVISNNSINIVTEKIVITKAQADEKTETAMDKEKESAIDGAKEITSVDAQGISGIIPKTGGAVDLALLLMIGAIIITAGLMISFRRIK
jgi:LPXTG-motif cell wall-anchored protein